MRNLRLDICYDGTRYRGWQRLANDTNTIQGKLEQALSRILEEPIELSGSGRTDAGVHAKGQVANFHCHSTMPADEILFSLRKYLPEDIGIINCKDVPERFHARLNARRKTYTYQIWNSCDPRVFQRKYVAIFPESLNITQMRAASAYLIGKHDFAAFSTKSKNKKSTIREIYNIDISKCGHKILISISADGFLYNMMRIIVGTLIEIGRGDRAADDIIRLFASERKDAGFLAPPQGLCLMEVEY